MYKLLSLFLDLFKLLTGAEVLKFDEVLDQGIASVDSIFDLDKVWFSILNIFRNCVSTLFDSFQPVGVFIPVIILQAINKSFSRLVMRLYGINILLHIARYDIQRRTICIKSLNNLKSTSIGSISRIRFSIDGKLKL